MKQTLKFQLFIAAALSINAASAADRIRNTAVASLIDQAAWDAGNAGTPGSSDRAVWNGSSVGGTTTLGGDASWSGILISSGTPISGPSFTNAANASPFTLTLGSAGIDLGNGASTNRGITFESNTKLDLAANQTWKLGLGGTSANIVVSSVVSGASSLEITRDAAGSNYVQLGGANTFSGGLSVSSGLLRMAVDSVTSGTIVVSGGVGTGNLALGDGVTVASSSGTTRVIAVPQLNIAGNVTLSQAATGTGRLQVAGTWNLGGAPRTVTLGKASTSYASGNEVLGFVRPSTGGNFGVPTVQNGSLTFTTVTGTGLTPSVVRIGATTSFESNAALTLDDGVALSCGTSSFFGTGTSSPALTLNAPLANGGGVLQMGDGISSGIAVTRSAQVYSLAGGGTVTSSNTTGTLGTGTLTINNGNSANFSGSITESGGTGRIALTKTGAGTQTLSGTNSYTGVTTISDTGSVLKFGKQVSLYNNTPANWTDTNIVVNSGATLALNVGGSGEFSTSDVAALVSLGTGSGGFKSNSKIGLDTTNAGGTVTYSSILANPNVGTNVLGLRKLGTGTLVLDQVNTYTGGTTVEGGGITIFANAGVGTGSLALDAGTVLNADFSGLVVPENFTHSITGTGTVNATPASGAANAFGFTSGTLTTFAGTINVKPSPASNTRVNFNGLIGSGATVNVDNGATGRFGLTGTYSGITVNAVGQGGDAGSAIRLDTGGVFDSACALNLLGTTSIGGFTGDGTIDCAIADGGNGYSLIKAGSSTLVLTATNTYTGGTSVTGGTLRISKPYLANSSAIVIGATAKLDLNFDETLVQVSDTVSTLTIDGVQQAAGIYGATGSGATSINNTNFAGVGTLTVLNGPAAGGNYASWANDPLKGNIPGQPALGDFDNDGLNNLTEYALGLNPRVSSVPPGTFSGGTLTFIKGLDAKANGDVTWDIETSISLGVSPNPWVDGGVNVTETANDISFTFPSGPLKNFARLKVTQVP